MARLIDLGTIAAGTGGFEIRGASQWRCGRHLGVVEVVIHVGASVFVRSFLVSDTNPFADILM